MLHARVYRLQWVHRNPDNALFHVFIGPLFANTSAYAYLDLVIWAISPLAFVFLRGPLIRYFSTGTHIYQPTFRILIACTLAMIPSYLFLNFSPAFRWNGYSETFNLDMGYFLFDFIIRTMEVILYWICRFWWIYSLRRPTLMMMSAGLTVNFSMPWFLWLIGWSLYWLLLLTSKNRM